MLTDSALRVLKPKEKDFKVADRDGMYVHVTTKGAMSFRMDYRLNGRRCANVARHVQSRDLFGCGAGEEGRTAA
ncbi:Arm DNA-binding domain-containing protein [Xanthobacter dioxanivorans]|uniref:Arm DNA-binding domain-containing protein n=1 Tax=Xanthobacter dioxanivorans TaxID=2528964 RepID=UPI0038CD3D06